MGGARSPRRSWRGSLPRTCPLRSAAAGTTCPRSSRLPSRDGTPAPRSWPAGGQVQPKAITKYECARRRRARRKGGSARTNQQHLEEQVTACMPRARQRRRSGLTTNGHVQNGDCARMRRGRGGGLTTPGTPCLAALPAPPLLDERAPGRQEGAPRARDPAHATSSQVRLQRTHTPVATPSWKRESRLLSWIIVSVARTMHFLQECNVSKQW